MSKKQVIIIGAGGQARVISSILNYAAETEIYGYIDRTSDTKGEKIGTSCVLGDHTILPGLLQKGIRYAIIGVGDNTIRAEHFDRLRKMGFYFINAVHPNVFFEKNTQLGMGNVLATHSVICHQTRIGDNCIINTGAIIDHETRIGGHVHIAPGVRIAGRVEIGDYSFIGIGAIVKDYVKIGRNVTVGAGAVVVNDLPDHSVAVGIPAKIKKLKVVE